VAVEKIVVVEVEMEEVMVEEGLVDEEEEAMEVDI
jgi:hypothetical protein